MNKTDWHLRLFLTPQCNFSCIYCNPNKLKAERAELTTEEIERVLKSAFAAGIQRVHWTGGEPTIKKDFTELMAIAKKIGYIEQVITTNGWNLYENIDTLINNGLNRVNISLDTLSAKKFKLLTGTDHFDNVIKSIDESSKKLDGFVKINVVAMKETLEEIPIFVDKISAYSKKNVVLKLICINPNNPAQLEKEGMEFFKVSNVTFNDIINEITKIGDIEEVDPRSMGDNPNIKYYRIIDKKVIVGIIANPSWNYKCGGEDCKKMRITPFGEVATCIQDDLKSIKEYSEEDLIKIFKDKMNDKKIKNEQGIKRIHYREQLGEMRFGEVSKPIRIEEFNNNAK